MYTRDFEDLIHLALREDFAPIGDITTDSIFIEEKQAKFTVNSRNQEGIISCNELVQKIYEIIDPKVQVKFLLKDKEKFSENQKLAEISGDVRSILKGERLFLNLWQRAISIATFTNQFVELIKNTNCKILETRKTTPGLRLLEKKAVLDGGGFNHRYNLSTGILIKDNHIKLAGNIQIAIERVIKHQPYLTKIEVEIDTLEQLEIALNYSIDGVLLDNFSIEDTKKAIKLIKSKNPQITIESSGGINLDTVLSYAETGVDYISIGSLTQAAQLIDIGLD